MRAALRRAARLGWVGDVDTALAISGQMLAAARSEPVRGPVVDLGSGGGVPGLALAAAQLGSEVVLVERSSRRAAFLTLALHDLGAAGDDPGAAGDDMRAAARDLGAGGDEVRAAARDLGAGGDDVRAAARDLGAAGHARVVGADVLAPDPARGRADVATARSFAPLGVTLEVAAHWVVPGGRAVLTLAPQVDPARLGAIGGTWELIGVDAGAGRIATFRRLDGDPELRTVTEMRRNPLLAVADGFT